MAMSVKVTYARRYMTSPRRETGQRRKPSHLLGRCAASRSAGGAASPATGRTWASVTVGAYPARLPHETQAARAP